jgi:outer membrane protein assembly factor BamE
MRKAYRVSTMALVLVMLLAQAGCAVVYKADVNQGNLLEKNMVDSLKPGMTRRQVALIMGTPSVQSPFDQDRWDYATSFSHRGSDPDVRSLSLFFEENVLVRIEGDYFDKSGEELLDDVRRLTPGRNMDLTLDKKKRNKRSGG